MLFLSCRVSQRDRDVPKVINPRRKGTDRARTRDTWVSCVSGELDPSSEVRPSQPLPHSKDNHIEHNVNTVR